MDSNVVAVAAPAIQHGPNGLYVYRVEPNNVVAVQPIQVARQEGDLYVVSSGLDDGALVVTDGQSRLQSGTHVAVREAPAEPAKSGT
jgi:multidrug efflux pump subunit AcrA (membrane-fusion protein)